MPAVALALVAAIAGVWALTNRTSFSPGGISTVTEPVQVAAAASEPAPPPETRAAEPAAVASAPASRASAPAAAPASAPASAGRARLPPGCEAPAGREPTQYTSPVADRPASYVYVESTRGDVRVCVIDSLNQARLVTLRTGESVNVSGTPPFTIRSAQWNDLKVFFQGLRVQLEPGTVTDHVVILPRRGN
jgi:cytoskeleton protein RodZ